MATVIESTPDTLYEIIDGCYAEKPSIGSYGHTLASILLEILGPFARSHGLGQAFSEVLFDLRPAVNRSRRPDVSFVSVERHPLNRRGTRGVNAWPLVPDLAAEIVSPTDSGNELLEKLEEYFRAGSRRVWLIYPTVKKVHVYESPTNAVVVAFEQTLSDEAILPGFRLPLVDLFGEEADSGPEA